MSKMPLFFLSTVFLLLVFACSGNGFQEQKAPSPDIDVAAWLSEGNQIDTATFAGGCFWCTEAYFERVEGVKKVVSGYAGGTSPNPTYEQVSSGETDYAEAIQVYYDPEVLSYPELLEVLFATMDPTQLNRQGPDVGEQYRSVVFFHDPAQQEQAQSYILALDNSGKYEDPIVTGVEAYTTFYEAEDYHQDYYCTNPGNPYIRSVAEPKVLKFEKEMMDVLKEEYKAKKE